MTKQFDTNPDPTGGATAPVARVGPPLPTAQGDSEILIALLDGGVGEKVGPFRIDKQLGKGGMGWVFKAWDDSLERPVALKVIAPELARHEESLARLRVEARSAARLSHPHIVTVYSFGEDRGLPYIAMEYLEGQDLAALLDKRGALPLAEGLRLIRESAEALCYAERQNVIHRDIKPSNILVTTSGAAKVMDFGLAKRVDVDTKITATGLVVGTPAYMAPEQAMGKQVDFRADMYSLGCTLFAALTGKAPFQGTGPVDIMLKHINEELPYPPEWATLRNGRLVEVLKRMTMKEPGARYISWSELVADLRMLEGNHDTLTIQTKALPRGMGAPKSRSPKVAIIAAVVVVPLVVGGVWLAMRRPPAPPPPADLGTPAAAVATAPAAVVQPTPAPVQPTPLPVLPTATPLMAAPVVTPWGDIATPVADQPGMDMRDQRRIQIIEEIRAGSFNSAAQKIELAYTTGDVGPRMSDGQGAFAPQAAAIRAAELASPKVLALAGKPTATLEERVAAAKRGFTEAVNAKDDEATWQFFIYLKVMMVPDGNTAQQWLVANRGHIIAAKPRADMLEAIDMLLKGPRDRPNMNRPGGPRR